jgi:hypothetical protein
MRSDSFEWTCSKLGVRTYQRLTETLGFPAGATLKKKKEIAAIAIASARQQ